MTAGIDVGGALRKVRAARGLSIEEAARDTRIRREFLEAIEHDDFDRLLGDVHVRGCLRTYASYLRLSPDKTVAAYASTRPEVAEPEPITVPLQPEPALGAPRRRDNHRLLVMIAATVLVLAAAFGILSARQPAPPPADLASSQGPTVSAGIAHHIEVAVLAREPVDVTIVADGGSPQRFSLAAGEGRSFDGTDSVSIRLSDGGAATVTVNGVEEGVPGSFGKPWHDSYSYGTASPSAP